MTGTTLILRAAAFAARKHRDQRRKDADASPHINHPLELARVLAEAGGVTDAATLCAALLHKAKRVKLADKICNLADVASSPPAGWSLERRREYFDWARQVIDRPRGVDAALEAAFDKAYAARP